MSNQSRTEWFEDARFGLFIHWNACAALEGRFCGEPVRQTEYGEWLRARNRVPRADWDRAIRQMRVTPEQVRDWVAAGADAGMKYVIFVSKHHDGLAYWPSDLSDHTINKLAGIDFDIVEELKAACDEQGMKLGLYYSHWHDWEHPYGWGNFWDYNSDDPAQFDGHDNFFFYSGEGHRDNLTADQFDVYWREKSMAQVKELIERYQPALLWFDCWRALSQTNMTEPQVRGMLSMIRGLDPAIVVNSRLAIPAGPGGTDYETLGDNEFPSGDVGHPWESAVTFNLSWGYNRDDQAWRPATYFIRNLVRNISLGGNLVINIGPYADGSQPAESRECMKTIGECLRLNGEGFYGCGRTPFDERTQDWGLTTAGSGNRLYLHVFDWPVDGVIRVNGLITPVRSATLCSEGRALPFKQSQAGLHVLAGTAMPVPYDTVIRLDLEGEPRVDNETIGESNGGGIALQAGRAVLSGSKLETPVEGSTKLPYQIGGWRINGSASWTFFIPAAGPYEVSICYACDVEHAGQSFEVAVSNGDRLAAVTRATHKNWSDFRPFTLGVLEFPAPGRYTLSVKPTADLSDELFKLLWVHLAPAPHQGDDH